LAALHELGSLDLMVDGADEVDPRLDLIKGLGGALLREKMVAQATQRMTIIIDEGKLVARLGTRSPLPVEVVPFSWESHLPFLGSLGAEPLIRRTPRGDLCSTDNGNYLLDCRFPQGILDPPGLRDALARRAGVVDSGLFLDFADEVIVGWKGEVKVISREPEKRKGSP
jgi:ribose 5-phosphate isomerase A